MTYIREDFYWLPAAGPYQQSIHLYVEDGCKVHLDMSDCVANTPFECKCDRCGHDDTALRGLTLDQLKELHKAIEKTIDYVTRPENKGEVMFNVPSVRDIQADLLTKISERISKDLFASGSADHSLSGLTEQNKELVISTMKEAGYSVSFRPDSTFGQRYSFYVGEPPKWTGDVI